MLLVQKLDTVLDMLVIPMTGCFALFIFVPLLAFKSVSRMDEDIKMF